MTIERGLAAAAARVAGRIAAEVPGDVAVRSEGAKISITGPRLAVRALTDARLRDFAGMLK